MNAKRFFFFLAILACIAFVLGNGRWEGRLSRSYQSWIIDLERSPVWSPPDNPNFAAFKAQFESSSDFPAFNTPDLKISRNLKINWMAIDFLIYVWPVLIIFGILIISKKGDVRDIILHLGFYAGIGLTVGAISCILLWFLFGGWGPPAPLFFGTVGTIGGFTYGYNNFVFESHESAKSNGQSGGRELTD